MEVNIINVSNQLQSLCDKIIVSENGEDNLGYEDQEIAFSLLYSISNHQGILIDQFHNVHKDTFKNLILIYFSMVNDFINNRVESKLFKLLRDIMLNFEEDIDEISDGTNDCSDNSTETDRLTYISNELSLCYSNMNAPLHIFKKIDIRQFYEFYLLATELKYHLLDKEYIPRIIINRLISIHEGIYSEIIYAKPKQLYILLEFKRMQQYIESIFTNRKINKINELENIDEWEILIALNDYEGEVYYNLGLYIEICEGNLEKSRKYYRKAIERNPALAEAYFALGHTYDESSEDLNLAKKLYQKAIHINTDYYAAYKNLLNLLYYVDVLDTELIEFCSNKLEALKNTLNIVKDENYYTLLIKELENKLRIQFSKFE